MDRLTIDVPSSVTTSYLVCTHIPADDPRALVEEQLRELLAARHPLAGPALDLLASPACQLVQLSVAESGWRDELLDIHGSAASRRAISAARHHLVLTVQTAVATLPHAAQAMRLTARSLAHATGGVLLDPTSHIILGDRPPGHEPQDFTLADHWVTVVVHHGDDPHHLRAQTWGLARFGLPELCTAGFAPATTRTAINLLRGLAAYLLNGQWTHLSTSQGGPARLLPASLAFDVTWVHHYYNRSVTSTACLPLLLRQRPNSPDGDLEVAPGDPNLTRGWRTAASTIPDLHPSSGRSLS